MSDAPDNDQKTESPTPKRKGEAAKNGDVLQSKELGTLLIMLAVSGWLLFCGSWFVTACLELTRSGLSFERADLRAFDVAQRAYSLIAMITLPLATLFALALIAAFGGPSVLGSIGFRAGSIGFKTSRINPVAGWSRMFGTAGLVELGKALAKTLTLGWIGYFTVTSTFPHSLALGGQDISTAAQGLGASLISTIIWMTVGLAGIAAIDVPIQIIRRGGRLRMTKQEVKEEMRQSDGAPELKQALRQRQHEVLNASARKGVPMATVILTNPTHFAIALRYMPGKDFAPIVVARGRDETAHAIKALGHASNVPILDYPQLARAIYFTSRVGQAVADDLYVAVATILAFVFNLEAALAAGANPPLVTVPETKQFDETGRRH
jgi:flagellar biosynthesis protein FlhB